MLSPETWTEKRVLNVIKKCFNSFNGITHPDSYKEC